MLKLLRRLILLFVLLVAAVIAGFFFVDKLIVGAVETAGSHALGVETLCGDADLGILSGDLELLNLTVKNPEGFRGDAFLEVDRVATELSLAKLLGGDTIELPRLELDRVRLSIESRDGKKNYEAIMDSLGRLKSEDPREEGKRFIIREVVIRDTSISLDLLGLPAGLGNLAFKIPELRLKDVGAEGNEGVLVAEVVGALVQGLLVSVVEMSGGRLGEAVSRDLGQRVTGLLKVGSNGWGLLQGSGPNQNPMGDILKGVGELLNRKKDGR